MSKLTDKKFWEYIEDGMGIVFKVREAMKEDGVELSRQAIYSRCNHTQEDKDRLAEIRTAIVDKAEKTMISLMDSEDEKIQKDSAKFVLETLGKDSGYSKRTELTGIGNEPISIQVKIIE